MRRTPGVLKTSLVAVALLVAACAGNGKTVAGTYDCGPDPAIEQFPPETWDLREDGTLVISARPPSAPEYTWSAEGDSLIITHEGEEDRFTIEGDRFISRSSGWPLPPPEAGIGSPVPPDTRWVCARTP
jgi:hypothetical protein